MRLEVHKFGGAAVRDADGVRNVSRIVDGLVRRGIRPIVVVSAMAKSTNALEKVWRGLPSSTSPELVLEEVRNFHEEVVGDLGFNWEVLHPDWLGLMEVARHLQARRCSDSGYDALVGFGERFSTRIVHAHLVQKGLDARWHSAWSLIRTDDAHRASNVDLEVTGRLVRETLGPDTGTVAVTQGFVGGTESGIPTTLGREGSDFSGALIAEALQAERLVVWKDVPGVMTGDPREWPLAKRIDRLDHVTAERMSRAGAGVLHPSTMAPLQRSDIPLEVRSFIAPDRVGTTIHGLAPEEGPGLLWAFAQDGNGRPFARCLTHDAERATDEWNRAFGNRPIQAIQPDPQVGGCLRLTWHLSED